MSEITITQHGEHLTVSSVQVAADFGKKHKNVIQTIDTLKAENSAVTPMFIESTYQAGTGKAYKCYNLTRDGFCLLVMGFTGKDALEWKLKYIEAFNLMEQKLRQPPQMTPMEMIAGIANGCVELENRTKQLEQRQTELEEKLNFNRTEVISATMEFGRIGPMQRAQISKAVKLRAINLCMYAPTYEKLGKRVIASIYKALQKKFDVPSYLDLEHRHYTDALIFIECYEPDAKLRRCITDHFPKMNLNFLNLLTETANE